MRDNIKKFLILFPHVAANLKYREHFLTCEQVGLLMYVHNLSVQLNPKSPERDELRDFFSLSYHETYDSDKTIGKLVQLGLLRKVESKVGTIKDCYTITPSGIQYINGVLTCMTDEFKKIE